jgi:hypothetical protein
VAHAPRRRCRARRRRTRRSLTRASSPCSTERTDSVTRVLEIVAAGMRFVARWEEELAAATVAAFRATLPIDDRIIHCAGAASRTGSRGAHAASGSARRMRPRTLIPASSRCIRRAERDGAALPVRLVLVRVEGGPPLGEPLRDGRRRRRAAARARPPHALGRRAAHLVSRAVAPAVGPTRVRPLHAVGTASSCDVQGELVHNLSGSSGARHGGGVWPGPDP